VARCEIPVSLPSLLQAAAGGRSEVTVEAETLQGALDALLACYPLLRSHLYEEPGMLREHVNIFWNDQNVRWLDVSDPPLKPGDTLTILQAVSGG
jgi:molybdopterin converting factor small subunit